MSPSSINRLILSFHLLFLQIFNEYYHFHHSNVVKRSINPAHHRQRRLADDNRVRWSKQQEVRSRTKRDFIQIRQSRASMSGKNRWMMNDPKWSQMWYLVSEQSIFFNVYKFVSYTIFIQYVGIQYDYTYFLHRIWMAWIAFFSSKIA